MQRGIAFCRRPGPDIWARARRRPHDGTAGQRAVAALLDVLKIDRVTVVGASAGGPPAYWFAIRHPGRINGLIVIIGVSGFYNISKTAGPITQAFYLSDFGQKILQKISDWNIRLVLQSLFQSESFFTRKEIKRQLNIVAGNPHDRRS